MYLCFIDIPCRNSAKISSGSGEEVDFVFAIFSNNAILDIRPGSGEVDFKGILPYMGIAAILVI